MTPVVFAILLAAADHGTGQATNGAPPPTMVKPAVVAGQKTEAAQSNPDKVVCRSEEQQGTRVRARKCMTQAQWTQQEEQTRQYFQDAADHGSINSASNNAMQPH